MISSELDSPDNSQGKNKPLSWSHYISNTLLSFSKQSNYGAVNSENNVKVSTWNEYFLSRPKAIIDYLWFPIIDVYKAISPLVGGGTFLGAIILEVGVVVAINYVQLQVSIALSQDKREMDKLLLSDSPDDMFNDMSNAVQPYVKHVVLTAIGSFVTDIVTRTTEVYLKEKAGIAHNNQLYKNKTFLRVQENKQDSRNLKSIPKEIGFVIRMTTSFIALSSIAAFNGLTAAYKLASTSQNHQATKNTFSTLHVIGIKFLFSSFSNAVSNYLSSNYTKNCKEAGDVRGKLQEMEANDQDNAPAIYAMNAAKTVALKINKASKKLSSIERTGAILQTSMKAWNAFSTQAVVALDYTLAAQTSLAPQSAKQASANAHHLSELSKTLGLKTEYSQPIAEVSDALRRISRLQELKTPTKTSVIKTYQERNPVINIASASIQRRKEGEKNWVRILQCDSQKTLQIKLTSDKKKASRWVVIGDAGTGKSTFFQMLTGSRENSNTTKISGTMCFPKSFQSEDSILYIAQKLYIPKSVSLLELISWPTPKENITAALALEYLNKTRLFITALDLDTKKVFEEFLYEALILEEEIKVQLQNKYSFILSELQSNISGFHEEKDWINLGFSGGEMKIFPLIWALCQEPKLLLLDETLNGMDANLIETTRQYLHNTLINTSIGEIYHFAAGFDPYKLYTQVINFNIYNDVALERSMSLTPKSFIQHQPTSNENLTSPIAKPSSLLERLHQEKTTGTSSFVEIYHKQQNSSVLGSSSSTPEQF